MYLTPLMQVTRLGCELPRSKESQTNPLMKTILTHISPPLMKLKLPFKKGGTESSPICNSSRVCI